MASILFPSSPAVEEFFNRNHSKSDGKFTSGAGGRAGGAPTKTTLHVSYTGNTPHYVVGNKATGGAAKTSAAKAASHFKNAAGHRAPVYAGKHTMEKVKPKSPYQDLVQRGKATGKMQDLLQRGKADPKNMIPATGASLKNGQIHLGGKAVTGKVRKDGNMWEAKLLGKENQATVMSGQHNSKGHALYKNEQNSIRESTRSGLVKAVEAHLAGQAADKRIGDAKSKAAYSPAQNNADGKRLNTMSSLVVEGLRHHGPTKASQITVSKDGSVKIKGQAQDFIKIGRGATESGRSGYTVTGAHIQASRGGSISKIFKTQAAAKMEVAKRVTAASLVN